MLAVSKYDPAYVEAVRAKLGAAQAAFAALRGEAGGARGFDALEHAFFQAQVMALDHYFDHRTRTIEGKDGNPLNELRMLCNSLMQGDGRLLADTQIRYDAGRSMLGIAVGSPFVVTAEGFARLADGVFAEVLKRFR